MTGRGRHAGIAWFRAAERDRSARNVHQSAEEPMPPPRPPRASGAGRYSALI